MTAFADLQRLRQRDENAEIAVARRQVPVRYEHGVTAASTAAATLVKPTDDDDPSLQDFLPAGVRFTVDGTDTVFTSSGASNFGIYAAKGIEAVPGGIFPSSAATAAGLEKTADETRRMTLAAAAPPTRFATPQLTDFDLHTRLTNAEIDARDENASNRNGVEANILGAFQAQDDQIEIFAYKGREYIDEVFEDLSAARFRDVSVLREEDELVVSHSGGDDVRLRIVGVIPEEDEGPEPHRVVAITAQVTEHADEVTALVPAQITRVIVRVPDTGMSGVLVRQRINGRLVTAPVPPAQAFDDGTIESQFRALRGRAHQRARVNNRLRWTYGDGTLVDLYRGNFGAAFLIAAAPDTATQGRVKLVTATGVQYLGQLAWRIDEDTVALTDDSPIEYTLPAVDNAVGEVTTRITAHEPIGEATLIDDGATLRYVPMTQNDEGFTEIEATDETGRTALFELVINQRYDS